MSSSEEKSSVTTSDDGEESDNFNSSSSSSSSNDSCNSESKNQRRVHGNQKVIDYKESPDSEEEAEGSHAYIGYDLSIPGAHTDTIEKVLSHRYGIPSATGPDTTWYNIEDKGDLNLHVDEHDRGTLELQFLIKWLGWSHFHNTWESIVSIEASGSKGIRKVENYIKRQSVVENWCRVADKEHIELYNCELELNEELIEQYNIAERIIAHQNRATSEYLVKWTGLPYSECTWEDEALLRRRFTERIKEFEDREKSDLIPKRTYPEYKKRPKFHKLEVMPEFLRPVYDDTELELRDYQLEGLNWLLHSWSRNHSCILADEMGLGKTIQAISFLSALFHVYKIYGPFLVVAPLSTMPSWQHEFTIWGRNLNVVMYLGDASSRETIKNYEIDIDGKCCRANVIITTYELILKDKIFLGKYKWSCLIVDEAHRLKNDDSILYQILSGFSTNHRLLITGTPLQNSLRELWALLHFIMPDRFDNLTEFERVHQDRSHKGISSLHKKLEPYLLRRVKKDVERSLSAKVEQILRVDMTAQQKQFYKLILTRNYEELSKGVKGSINGFINIMMELKKSCNHCCLVRQYDYIEEDSQARLQQLLKSSGKLILLDKLLCRLKETGHRVLIFSQMVVMLDILEEYLRLRKFLFQRLDGSMSSHLRKQALDHFNASGSSDFCFLLSTRAGGLGINLATADTVIIYDSDWNPQNDLQAMSRAHRIGQKNRVNIYRLVTKNSVEEEIVERAKQKLVLDHLIIQRMDTSGKTVLSKNVISHSSRIPFDKSELTAILKFGAAELFREKDDHQDIDFDIDDILNRAETRECENVGSANDLLNSFKYANFVIDEERDLASLSQSEEQGGYSCENSVDLTHKTVFLNIKEDSEKEWNDIIPLEEIEKLKETNETANLSELMPRPRPQLAVIDTDDESTSSLDDKKVSKKIVKPKIDLKQKSLVKKKRKLGDIDRSDISLKVKVPRNISDTSLDVSKSSKRRLDSWERAHSMSLNKRKYDSDLKIRTDPAFMKCVEIFRPYLKYIKKMVKTGNPLSSNGLKYLVKLGDHITKHIVSLIREKQPVSVQKQWHNYLWIFLSQFVASGNDPAILLDAYRANAKVRIKKGTEHRQHCDPKHPSTDTNQHSHSKTSPAKLIHLTCGSSNAVPSSAK